MGTFKIGVEQFIKDIESLRDGRGIIKAGLPRFNQLFGRDSLIVSWQLLDFDPKIARQTLEVLSKLQGKKTCILTEEEPGIILHQEKYGPIMPYYGSVDATPLYLIVFGYYLEKTRDIDLAKEHWENIINAANWMINYGDKDGDNFLEYKKKIFFGFYDKGWKDSIKNIWGIKQPTAIVEAQGYQYLALEKTAETAILFKKNDLAAKLRIRAGEVKEYFNDKFWMPDEKYFALALDGKKERVEKITSNQGHLLFTGIVDKDKEEFIVRRLFEEDLWTQFGIRNHSEKEPDFDPRSYHLGSVWPHDNWIIAQGLKELRYKNEYLKIKNALFKAYEKMGFVPEYFGVVNGEITLDMKKKVCSPQAWSSGAMLNFLTTE